MPKRTLIAYGLGDTGKDFALAPEIRWRALRNLAGPEASLELTVSQRSSEQASASKIFSKAFGGFVDAVRKGCADRMQEGTISHAGEEAFKRTPPFPFLASSLSSQLMHQHSWKSSALPAEPRLPSICFLSLPQMA